MARKIVLLDLDGTLWDSYPWYATIAAPLTGVSVDHILEQLRSGKSIVSLVVGQGVKRPDFKWHCLQHLDGLTLYAGVQQTLPNLLAEGAQLGIVTSLPAWLADPLLEGMGVRPYFDALNFCARKPSPAAILAALETLKADHRDVIYYVGDTENDAGAAHRAGIKFVWAAYGYGSQRPSSSAVVLNNFSDVLNL